MAAFNDPVQWILGSILILASLGVITVKKPIYASLSFLLTLLMLAALYLQLSAEFIGIMQVLVYAGAILVIFMFVIILFQDAYQKINDLDSKSSPALLLTALGAFLVTTLFMGSRLIGLSPVKQPISEEFGTAHSLGFTLYLDFFFPFEAVILIFLVAVIGALYIAKKEI